VYRDSREQLDRLVLPVILAKVVLVAYKVPKELPVTVAILDLPDR